MPYTWMLATVFSYPSSLAPTTLQVFHSPIVMFCPISFLLELAGGQCGFAEVVWEGKASYWYNWLQGQSQSHPHLKMHF